eukprot:TRINITY_DN146_c1_g1_i1.p1 TRINITY_DN146_c1_g1~~TRINITY_DN146_c1_g1_i1.p1  ORF type:complete len:734 (+),score=189.76 TRINITY_DN146_c1_g1_i1:87-2204(+)
MEGGLTLSASPRSGRTRARASTSSPRAAQRAEPGGRQTPQFHKPGLDTPIGEDGAAGAAAGGFAKLPAAAAGWATPQQGPSIAVERLDLSFGQAVPETWVDHPGHSPRFPGGPRKSAVSSVSSSCGRRRSSVPDLHQLQRIQITAMPSSANLPPTGLTSPVSPGATSQSGLLSPATPRAPLGKKLTVSTMGRLAVAEARTAAVNAQVESLHAEVGELKRRLADTIKERDDAKEELAAQTAQMAAAMGENEQQREKLQQELLAHQTLRVAARGARSKEKDGLRSQLEQALRAAQEHQQSKEAALADLEALRAQLAASGRRAAAVLAEAEDGARAALGALERDALDGVLALEEVERGSAQLRADARAAAQDAAKQRLAAEAARRELSLIEGAASEPARLRDINKQIQEELNELYAKYDVAVADAAAAMAAERSAKEAAAADREAQVRAQAEAAALRSQLSVRDEDAADQQRALRDEIAHLTGRVAVLEAELAQKQGLAASVDDLVVRCRRVSLTPQEQSAVSEMLGELRKLDGTETKSDWKALASCGLKRRPQSAPLRGRSGSGAEQPPPGGGTRAYQQWRSTLENWLDKHTDQARAQQLAVLRIARVYAAAEARERRDHADWEEQRMRLQIRERMQRPPLEPAEWWSNMNVWETQAPRIPTASEHTPAASARAAESPLRCQPRIAKCQVVFAGGGTVRRRCGARRR